jgi:hypothetical protein
MGQISAAPPRQAELFTANRSLGANFCARQRTVSSAASGGGRLAKPPTKYIFSLKHAAKQMEANRPGRMGREAESEADGWGSASVQSFLRVQNLPCQPPPRPLFRTPASLQFVSACRINFVPFSCHEYLCRHTFAASLISGERVSTGTRTSSTHRMPRHYKGLH